MADYNKGISGLIGNTPLVEVANIEKELGLAATVLVKLEYLNPAGSVKDRVAKAMIEDAEEKDFEGRLRHYRAYFRQYRNWTCGDCSRQGIPHDPDDAGDDERRAQEYFKGVRRRACAYRRSKRHDGSD